MTSSAFPHVDRAGADGNRADPLEDVTRPDG
jgi:hypothetical protein